MGCITALVASSTWLPACIAIVSVFMVLYYDIAQNKQEYLLLAVAFLYFLPNSFKNQTA
jgi:hypothetical protein